jgi:hypothetical protein
MPFAFLQYPFAIVLRKAACRFVHRPEKPVEQDFTSPPRPASVSYWSTQGLALALLLCFSSHLLAAQIPKKKPYVESPKKQAEIRKEMDRARGITPEKRLEINNWLILHPGLTEADYWKVVRHVKQVEVYKEAIRKRGAALLNTPDAKNWGYRGSFDSLDPLELASAVTVNEPLGRPSEGFLIEEDGTRFSLDYPFSDPKDSPVYQNTIRVLSDEKPSATDLTRFFQVNNQMLRDVGMRLWANDPKAKVPPMYPELEHSEAIVITGARVGRDEELVTVFRLSDSAKTGALVGDLHTASPKTRLTSIIRRKRAPIAFSADPPPFPMPNVPRSPGDPFALQGSHPAISFPFGTTGDPFKKQEPNPKAEKSFGSQTKRMQTDKGSADDMNAKRVDRNHEKRIYYYGDNLKHVDLADIAERLGYELIHRSPRAQQKLLHTERRLAQISSRTLDPSNLAVVNGLPRTMDAVRQMGIFMGDPQVWLNFETKVSENIDGKASRIVTDSDDFVSELVDGNSDILILVAHSTGAYLYLNREKLSVKELQALRKRKKPSTRPRVAVLITCDAGRGTAQAGFPNSELWSSFFKRDIVPLAQILVDHGWVDKVIAPDHKIQPDESIAVLNHALEGARTSSIFKNWVHWALNWMERREPLG